MSQYRKIELRICKFSPIWFDLRNMSIKRIITLKYKCLEIIQGIFKFIFASTWKSIPLWISIKEVEHCFKYNWFIFPSRSWIQNLKLLKSSVWYNNFIIYAMTISFLVRDFRWHHISENTKNTSWLQKTKCKLSKGNLHKVFYLHNRSSEFAWKSYNDNNRPNHVLKHVW